MNSFREIFLWIILICCILRGGFVSGKGLGSITKADPEEDFEYETVIKEDEDPFECPTANGNINYPHPIYCEKYYRCRNGVAELLTCSRPNDLLFNDVDAACYHAWDTHCKNRIRPGDAASTIKPPPPETTTQIITTPSTTLPPTVGTTRLTTTTLKPTTTTEVSFNCTVNGAFPHSEYCQLYIDCWEGVATILSCPNSTLFDTEYFGCKEAESTDCGDRQRPGLFECPNGEDAYYPDPDDCSGFFQCKDGISYHHQCPQDLVFNPEIDVCDFPSNVDCAHIRSSSSSSTLSSFPSPS